jgi:hypothetical protein
MAKRPPDNSPGMGEHSGGPPQRALLAALRQVSAERERQLDEVARVAGLADVVARVEAGEGELRLRDVAALCAVLDVRVSELTARAETLGQGEGEQ